MRKIILYFIFYPALVFAQTQIEAVKIMDGFDSPIAAAFPPGRSQKLLIAEEKGKLLWLDLNSKNITLAYDATQGIHNLKLVDLVFHYDFEKNGRIFVAFLEFVDEKIDLVVQELSLSEQPTVFKEVLRLRQPANKAKDFSLAFDKSQNLLIALPDGAEDFDPKQQSQDQNQFWGKLIRFNIKEAEYIAPLDNPFVMEKIGKKEIYAIGFREPANMLQLDGDMYVSDRGADTFQELNLIKSGLNYGWSKYEGSQCLGMQMDCIGLKQEKPVFDYTFKLGNRILFSSINSKIVIIDAVSSNSWIFEPKTLVKSSIKLTTQLKLNKLFSSNDELFGLDKSSIYKLSLK